MTELESKKKNRRINRFRIMRLSVEVDYKTNIFEIPELTKIHGEPSTATLLI